MAKLYAYWSLYWNPLPIGKDKLAKATLRVPTNGNKTFTHTPAISCALSPNTGLSLIFANSIAK